MIKANKRGIVIAVDGPSASGKGTLSRRVAHQLGYDYLDTGLLYRAVAAEVIKNDVDLDDIEGIIKLVPQLDIRMLNSKELGTEEIGAIASQVAILPKLRQALYDIQRDFALNKPGVIVDGRDIGSVIFPDAECKLYITANVEVRAMRRFKQLQELGKYATYERVLQDLKARDARDYMRDSAPLLVACGAIVIDTSELSISEAVSLMLREIRNCFDINYIDYD